jgi:hypothetical protein
LPQFLHVHNHKFFFLDNFGKLGAVEMGFVGLVTDGGDVDVEVIGVPETVFGGFVTGFEEVLLTGGA